MFAFWGGSQAPPPHGPDSGQKALQHRHTARCRESSTECVGREVVAVITGLSPES